MSWSRRWCAGAMCAAVVVAGLGAAGGAETLPAFLESGALAKTDNPVAATFFAEQAAKELPADLAQRAADQLHTSLKRQTSAMALMMEGVGGMSGGRTTQEVTERMRKQTRPTNMVGTMIGGALGLPIPGAPSPSVTQRESQAMHEEMIHGFADPWIRGVEAARAMERLGDAQSAGRFYMNCIQMVSAEWMKDAALDGILAMGPRRAYTLLSWMAENAEDASITAAYAEPPPEGRGRKPEPDMGTVALRGAALRGLGALVGAGVLSDDERANALALLLGYAAGDDHAPFFADAATGLGRTRDPAAVEPLQRLARWRKDRENKVAPAADAALATGFHDAAAAERLRRLLKSKLPEVAMRALPLLLSAGDAETLAWTVRTVTGRRVAEDTSPDLRPQVVRELVSTPDARGQQTLAEIAAKGAGNDWLREWVAVALLETGDLAQLPAVRAHLYKTDWALDRPGLKYFLSRIQPYVNLALGAAMGSPVTVQQVVQLLANTASQELAARREKATDRELVSLQLRFQAATALGRVNDAGAVVELDRLLDDEELSVRMSAATALAVSPHADAIGGIVHALALDFGSENGVARAPQIRAVLLRSAVMRFPDDPRTRELCAKAAADEDAGVRFIALVALAKT